MCILVLVVMSDFCCPLCSILMLHIRLLCANKTFYLLAYLFKSSAVISSSVGQIIKSVRVSRSIDKTSWTLYMSQSFINMYQTCYQGRVPGDEVTYCIYSRNIYIRQTGSVINFHYCFWEKPALISNKLKTVRYDDNRSPKSLWLALWPLTFDELELY